MRKSATPDCQRTSTHCSIARPLTPSTTLGMPLASTTWSGVARLRVPQAVVAVLAEMLGVSPATAMKHAALAGADYAHYAPPSSSR